MATVASPAKEEAAASLSLGELNIDPVDAGVEEVGEMHAESDGKLDAANEIIQLRICHLLEENASLCEEFHCLGHELASTRLSEEMLQDTWKVSNGANARQKMVSQNTFRNMNQSVRSELQRASEMAQQLSELREVQSQLTSVNRQLTFAADLQSRALDDLENRLSGKARQIRKLELTLYQVVSSAQLDPRLEGSIADVVAQCGPLVHSVLSREAQRQAAQLAGQYLINDADEGPCTSLENSSSAPAPSVTSIAPSAPATVPPAGRKKRPAPVGAVAQYAPLEGVADSGHDRGVIQGDATCSRA